MKNYIPRMKIEKFQSFANSPQRWRRQTQHQTNSMGVDIGSLLVLKVITHKQPGSTTWEGIDWIVISFPIYIMGLKSSFQAIKILDTAWINHQNEWNWFGEVIRLTGWDIWEVSYLSQRLIYKIRCNSFFPYLLRK